MFHGAQGLDRRQLWSPPTPTTAQTTAHCTPFTLPSNGVIELADSVITLTTDVIFQPECTGALSGDVFAPTHLKDPFYASVTPMTYVIASATVIAWILVIMLAITPRTGFLGTSFVAPSFSTGHGIIGGANGGSTSLNGAGSRPWLQKVATLAVAISLTIATADTFEVAERQYLSGYMDASDLRDEVLQSLEIRITRVISDVFLWLAQVQTLVRLFPRHKEKVLIKWIGFALILFDTVFGCLNSFLIAGNAARGRRFTDAIPALSYLFELALGLLYAAWVIYYALTKRRYAFYHPLMRNICIIALLSVLAILTPVVFFVTDVSNYDVAGWGDYFRWVGAAAASVVVWEWVERIEALEREEKKDGILGREVFDGDEMLDVSPSEEAVWTQSRGLSRHFRRRHDDDNGNNNHGNPTSALENGISNVAQRFRSRHVQSPAHFPIGRAHSSLDRSTVHPGQSTTPRGNVVFTHLPKPENRGESAILGTPTPPPQVASPVSRTDTTSAASTVYVVRYHPVVDAPQPIRRRPDANGNTDKSRAVLDAQKKGERDDDDNIRRENIDADEDAAHRNRSVDHSRWHAMPNPFKRKRASPPQEVQQARAAAAEAPRAATPAHNFSRWDFKNRLGVLAAETGERFRDRNTRQQRPDVDLPLTVVPAQPRNSGRTWSPGIAGEVATVTADNVGPDNPYAAPGGPSMAAENTVFTRQVASPPRADDIDLVGGRVEDQPTVIPALSRTPQHSSNHDPGQALPRRDANSSTVGPPRADDISPSAERRGQPVIVPAPRRQPPHASGSASGSARSSAGT